MVVIWNLASGLIYNCILQSQMHSIGVAVNYPGHYSAGLAFAAERINGVQHVSCSEKNQYLRSIWIYL